MRTTLDIDERALELARARAKREGTSVGKAVSELVLQGVRGSSYQLTESGIPVFSPPPGVKGHVVTLELVNRYRDDE